MLSFHTFRTANLTPLSKLNEISKFCRRKPILFLTDAKENVFGSCKARRKRRRDWQFFRIIWTLRRSFRKGDGLRRIKRVFFSKTPTDIIYQSFYTTTKIKRKPSMFKYVENFNSQIEPIASVSREIVIFWADSLIVSWSVFLRYCVCVSCGSFCGIVSIGCDLGLNISNSSCRFIKGLEKSLKN